MTAARLAAGRVSRPAVAAAVVIAAAVAVRLADPAAHDVPLCPFHAVTGLNCPLCGGLRCAEALTRLDLGTALRANVLVVLAVPLLAAYWVDWWRRDRAGLRERRMPRAVLVSLCVLALVFAVVRNLPGGEWLSPPS